jgi:translation initiation factor IF-3
MSASDFSPPRLFEKVLLINEQGEREGEMSYGDARNIARERGLDLIPVSRQAPLPVYKIYDRGKWEYEQKKAKKKANAQHQKTLKEVWLSARIADHDLQVKAGHVDDWLEKGHSVKIVVELEGRERSHPQIGRDRMAALLGSLKLPFRRDPERTPSTKMIITTIHPE